MKSIQNAGNAASVQPGKTRKNSNRFILTSKQRKKLESAPSWGWANDIAQCRTPWPIRGDTGPGMVKSLAKVLTGDMAMTTNPKGELGSHRWTPPNNVNLEDMLDLMRPRSAEQYKHPSAITYQTGYITRVRAPKRAGRDNRVIRKTVLSCEVYRRREHKIRRNGYLIGFVEWTEENWAPVETFTINA